MMVGNPQSAQAEALPQVHQMSVSQETLDLLVQGRDTILQRRQQLVQQIQQLDAALHKQEGGIAVMENLLAGQQQAVHQPVEEQREGD